MNRLPIFFLFLLITSISTASATNVTFSDLNLDTSTEILIYQATSPTAQPQLIGTFNSTDTVDLDGNYEYVFVFKPGIQHWYENPLNAVDLLNREAPALLSFVLFLVVIVGASRMIFR